MFADTMREEMQLLGALVDQPSSPSVHRSHSAQWRAKFEARKELVQSSKAPVAEPPPRGRGPSWETAGEDAEPAWLASASAILEEPTDSAKARAPLPAVTSILKQPGVRQEDVLRLDQLEPDSFLAQLILAAADSSHSSPRAEEV